MVALPKSVGGVSRRHDMAAERKKAIRENGETVLGVEGGGAVGANVDADAVGGRGVCPDSVSHRELSLSLSSGPHCVRHCIG